MMPCRGLSFPTGLRFRHCVVPALLLCAVLIACVGGVAGKSYAQYRVLDSATLTDTSRKLDLGQYTIIQDDNGQKITPDVIRSSRGSVLSGKISKQNIVNLGKNGGSRWLSIKLFNQGLHNDWVIDLGRRVNGRLGPIEKLSAYELTFGSPDGSGQPSVNLVELSSLQDQGVFKISLNRNQQKLILFNVETRPGLPVLVPLKIYKEDAYLSHVQKRAMLTTFYSLILGGFAFVFFATAIFRQRQSHMIFGAYFVFNVVTWMTYDYFGSMIQASGLPIFVTLMMLGYSGFAIFTTKIFYGIDYNAFTEKYILYAIFFLNVGLSALTLIMPIGNTAIHSALLFGAPIFTFSVVSLMSFAQSRNGAVPGLKYCFSWLIPLAGYCTTAFSQWGWLPQETIYLCAYWCTIPIQGLLLALALRQKILYGADDDRAAIDALNLNRLKETKDSADHSRLLKVIEKEREALAEFRAREASRTEEMRHAKEAADEANRAKSAFLAVVSHEIRTPMTGVMGMVRLLLDSNINRQQREYVMAIQESSDAMLALLNDILDFEKIQQGKIELENISFDLHRLIQGVVTLMSGHATERGISLTARMDDNIPKYVKGDPTRLRQVLLNLMGNAIKFTSKGGVNLYVKNLNSPDAPQPDNKFMIYFAVQDTGIGISSEGQKNLFNPFSQANSSIARQFGGTGLGLAISKGLIERMGSSINISSREGEGSTFFFTLETERGLSVSNDRAAKEPAVPFTQAPAKPLKIMVVDDNAITRKVIAGFLEPSGHEIIGCDSAEQALSKIYNGYYDLVLMDIELPNMKGNEATKLLREYGDQSRAQIPVIALTGNVNKEDMQRYLADGMNGFVAKPIDPEKLKSIVNEIGSKRFEREIKAPGGMPMPNLPPVQGPATIPTPLPAAPDYQNVFNPDMLQSLKDTIGAKPLEELLTDLLVKTEEILVAMDYAVQIEDFDALAARAHELKGMAGNFGLVEISSIAAQAEKKAKLRELTGLSSLVDTLPAANTRAKGILKDWVAA